MKLKMKRAGFFFCSCSTTTKQKLTQPFDLLPFCRVNSEGDKKDQEEDGEQRKKGPGRGKKDMDASDSDDDDDDDDDDDLSDLGDDDDEGEVSDNDSEQKKTQKKSDVLPDVSRVNVKD